jgi:TrmH family RNA methyltransferase
MERISSRQNPIVKRFRALARAQPGSDDLLLDGQHLVEEAASSRIRIDTVVFTDAALERLGPLAEDLQRRGARTFSVTPQVLEAISPVRQPSGVVGIAGRRSSTVADVLRAQPALVLILCDVQDPGNVGAIIRAAEACGATGVIAAGSTADPFGWKALRGAMGSTFRVPVAAAAAADAVRDARAAHLAVLGTSSHDGTPLRDVDLRQPSAILIGGEGSGVPPALLAAADARIRIPMAPPVESLNVAVAAALVLYEASRQRP